MYFLCVKEKRDYTTIFISNLDSFGVEQIFFIFIFKISLFFIFLQPREMQIFAMFFSVEISHVCWKYNFGIELDKKVIRFEFSFYKFVGSCFGFRTGKNSRIGSEKPGKLSLFLQ